jgi:hypothetical protein
MSKRKKRKRGCLICNYKRCIAIEAMVDVAKERWIPPSSSSSNAALFTRWYKRTHPSQRTQEMVYAAMLWVDFKAALDIYTNAKGIRDAARLAQCWAAMR